MGGGPMPFLARADTNLQFILEWIIKKFNN